MRLVGVTPFQLVQADLDIEEVTLVFILVADKLLVNGLGILQFVAVFYIHQPGGLEEVVPPCGRMLLDEIVLKDIHVLIGRSIS